MISFKSPLPVVWNRICPFMIYLKDMSGWERAICSIRSETYPPSVAGCFKNLRRTGVLKNRFLTMIVVPSGAPTSSVSLLSAPSSKRRTPSRDSFVLVIISTFATAAILDRASPLKPRLEILDRSDMFLILLVACLTNALSTCVLSMPQPLSVMRIMEIPPSLISTVTESAPASIEFSTNSFTTLEGRSTTSPAAILSIVS